jgi:uncharacterized protein YbbK (DUF523 family)
MNIFVSACLMGQEVRYDGNHNKIESSFLDTLSKEHTLFSLCPEIEGGLNTPRTPAEIVEGKVMTKEGEDVSRAFDLGAIQTLQLCLNEEIHIAILKANSPSCGNNTIYDGTFSSTLVQGSGKTAQLLKEHGIVVFNEKELLNVEAYLNEHI